MQFPNSAGIYQILNLVNGKIYVGSSINLDRRKIDHWSRLRCKKHSNKHLQNAWDKYGEDKFSFQVLQVVESEKSLAGCEQFWISRTSCDDENHGYNLMTVKDLHYTHSAKTKAKLGDISRGRKHTEETKLKMSNNNYWRGKTLSIEHKMKMSITKKKNYKKENHGMYGKYHSEKTKNKISITLTGNCLTEECKKKLSIANKGSKNASAKLNEFQRRIIRRLCDGTSMRNPEIAEYFPVSSSHISNLRANRIWKL